MKNSKRIIILFLLILIGAASFYGYSYYNSNGFDFLDNSKDNSDDNFKTNNTESNIKECNYPFPQHFSYPGQVINISTKSSEELDNDVIVYYNTWKNDYLIQVSTQDNSEIQYRISFGKENPGRTVSEGQGYGMLIVVLMAGFDTSAQEIFNGLWRFVLAHPSKIDHRLMAWQVPESENGEDSAFDGDADIACALLTADKQWGSSGDINYYSAAINVIEGIKESTIGPTSNLPMLGDWVDPNGDIYSEWTTRTSDFILSHFRSFKIATNNSIWDNVIKSIKEAISSIQTNYSPTTGLIPDFIFETVANPNVFQPVSPNFLEGPYDGAYYYNAARDPWRLGTDALLTNDSFSSSSVLKIANWVRSATSDNPNAIKSGYYLDGNSVPNSDYFSNVFAAPIAVSLLLDPNGQSYLTSLYELISTNHVDYFEDTITMLCLLVLSGNYWDYNFLEKII